MNFGSGYAMQLCRYIPKEGGLNKGVRKSSYIKPDRKGPY